MDPKHPMSTRKIPPFAPSVAKWIGLPNPDKVKNHYFRSWGTNNIINAPDTNPLDAMTMARHDSVHSQILYLRTTPASQVNFQLVVNSVSKEKLMFRRHAKSNPPISDGFVESGNVNEPSLFPPKHKSKRIASKK